MATRQAGRGEPKITVFIGSGAVLGFLAGSLLHILSSDNGQYSARTALGYMAVFGMLLGGLLGGVAAAVFAGSGRR